MTSPNVSAEAFTEVKNEPIHLEDKPLILVENNNDVSYDSVTIDIKPYLEWNSYVVRVEGGNLTINGNTSIFADAVFEGTVVGKNWGNYIFYADKSSSINLLDNVEIALKQDLDLGFINVGGNAIYSRYNNSQINIGNPDSFTKLWVISSQPDVISAKDGGKVTIQSTHNQIVGNVDTMAETNFDAKVSVSISALPALPALPNIELTLKNPGSQSTVETTFSGTSSYWLGDEKSWNNVGGLEITEISNIPDAMLKKLLESGLLSSNIDSSSTNAINFTFENGAQWIYLGLKNSYEHTEPISDSGETVTGNINQTVKRISSITLQNGGIVNLYEASIEDLMQDTGLTELMPDYAVKHNYVRIGDLKGSGGIFRLDLDSQNIADSDMVFVEGSSTGGMHYIEPYNLEKLTNITPENTLRFATVKTDSGVTFADKQNFYGESLYDYELEIASETYDPNDPNNAQYEDRVVEDGENALAFDNTYTNWVITRIIRSSSAASLAMTGIGYAAYDTITQMDSYHDRVDGQSRANNGLWIRYRYGHGGIDNQYRRDYDTLTIGAQLLHNNSQSAGIAVSLNNSDVDLVDVTGTGESDGYEVMLYNTWLLGSHYIDVVGRIGQLDTEFNAVNQIGTLSTSGDFEQNYFALSGEYGYRYTDEHNVFLEPQLQLQYTHIKSESYKTNRNLWADIDSANVLTARAGVRAGKEWSGEKTAGEVYLSTNVFYQFTDGQDASYTDGSNTVDVTWGDRDAWLNVGLTANMQIQDRVNLQVQVSKDFAGDVKNTWYAQARLGYLF